MQFPEKYFENEIREGFFVPSMVKRAWAAELEVLSQIDRICTKYGIQYFAEWGTLLGAVRHNGFIPWDDDIDIGMKRADYERFLEVAESELPKGYKINNLRSRDDFWLFLARVMNTEHMCYTEEHLRRYHEFPYITGVDIFVMDYVSRDEDAECTRDTLADYLIVLADHIAERKLGANEALTGIDKLSRMGCMPQADKAEIREWLSGNDSEKIKRYIDELHQRMYIKAEELFARFNDDESDELTQLYPFGLRRREHRYPKEYYADCVRVPFENITIPIPIGYDAMLRKRYGDYLEIYKDVSGHGYPFYESQQAQLDELMDVKLPSYEYTDAEMAYAEGRHSGENRGNSFKALAVQVCSELEKADDAYSAQELAVDFGTMIEQLYGEKHPTVGCLEDYCELLYRYTQNEADETAVLESVSRISESVKKDIVDRKEAVLVVSRTEEWKYIRSVYESLKNQDLYIYVVVVPYYHKHYDGSLYDGRYEYDEFCRLMENEPAQVKLVQYNQYDIVLHHPDYVYIQNPYDRWDYGISIHPDYYTDKLVRNCENMIYVPPFALDENTVRDEREYHNMNSYVTVPGVVRANKVYVQSENMRTGYIDKLTGWAGEGSRGVWENKITDGGTQTADYEAYKKSRSAQSDKDLPEEWKKLLGDGKRKMILYHNEAAFFLENREKAIEKIERAFNVFVDNGCDTIMLWNVAEETLDVIRRVAPELTEGIRNLAEKAGMIGICDISDGKRAVMAADAYYGDGCYLARMCQLAGKPIMIENIDV